MPRRMAKNHGGRHPQPKSRNPQIKLTFGGKTGLKNGVPTVTTISKGTKRRAASYSDSDTTTDGDVSDMDEEDDESEEADDESDEPEAMALLHSASLHGGAGLDSESEDSDTDLDEDIWMGFPEVSDADAHVTSRPGSSWDDYLDNNLFRSDDDYEYEKVNDIGDDDEDSLEAIQASEEAHMLSTLDGDVTSHFANQIDGMSEYGFGSGDEEADEDDTNSVLMNWSSGDEARQTLDRRVRFEEHMDAAQLQQVGPTDAFSAFDHSPAMARALLPSALPDKSDDEDTKTASTHDEYDSDATDELDEPAQTWHMSETVREQQPDPQESSPSARRSPQKGPVRGTFEDDGDKVSAVLDSTGRKLLLQDPHLLGGVFARKYGPSAPASPSNSFASAVLEDSDDDASINETPAQPHPLDISLAVMSSQHESIPEQDLSSDFMLAKQTLLSDFIVADGIEDDGKGPDGDLNFEDLISVGSSNDDGDLPSPSGRPFFPHNRSAPGTPLSHLNHLNVTAFKRKADSRYSMGTPFSPILNQFSGPDPCSSPLRAKHITPLKRKRRVDKHESPYNHSHYNGVTPVQRVAHHEHENSPAPSTSRMHKRRRTLA